MRVLRRVLGAAAALLLALFAAWMGIALWARGQAPDLPFSDLAKMVGSELLSRAECALTGCPPELVAGLELSVFDDDVLLRSTPVAIDADEHGRLYVAESDRIFGGVEDNRDHPEWVGDDLAARSVADRRAYYEKWLAAGEFEDPDHFTARYDALVRLSDTDADGVADRREELATWRDAVDGPAAGVLVREGDVYAATIPGLFRLRDDDGDGEAELRETLATGFGVKTSLPGHDLHGLVFGPDGRLYFSMGDRGYRVELPDGRVLEPALGPGRGAVLRMHADGSGLEVYATGLRNPQELAFDDFGNLFSGDNNADAGDLARIVYVVEGGETGWAMPFQTLFGDYVRGPWMAERLWERQHETQPAWILPPIAHLGTGPAGLAHNPGLGLRERYRGYFLLADYGYTMNRSGVWAFAVEPDGAGFRVVDEHPFAWSILATDVDFAWDGRIFVSDFDEYMERQGIRVLRDPEVAADPRLARLGALAREGMGGRDAEELVALLGFGDRRIRLRAQYELARRGEAGPLAALARDRDAALLPRLHALWGLGQLGAPALRGAGWSGLGWLAGEPPELRAQAAKVAGESGAAWLAPQLVAWLRDPEPRVRFFAAQALGQLGRLGVLERPVAEDAGTALFALLHENADRDVFLRHAAVFALHRIGAVDAALARAGAPDAATRRAALLVLRHGRDPRIARFLSDPDPLLVVEAARAIYDLPLDAAMPALAALAPGLAPVDDDDTQVGQALHRRVIGANLRLRDETGALALAGYAADAAQLERLRELALEALGEYASPGPRDYSQGFHRPLPEVPPEVVFAALDAHGRALVEGDLGGRALEIATHYGRVPLDDAELAARVRDAAAEPALRSASLAALAARPGAAGETRAAIALALASDADGLRADAREILVRLDPDAGLEALLALDGDASLRERQRAIRGLAALDDPRAVAALAAELASLEQGRAPRGVMLDVIEAVRGSGAPELVARLEAWQERVAADAAAARVWALEGGEAARGEAVFQGAGDCQRCHGAGAGHGGAVGPPLDGVVARRGREHVLRSLVDPQAEIAEGYATIAVTRSDGSRVTGLLVGDGPAGLRLDSGGGAVVEIAAGDVASRTQPASGMPPLGLSLAPRDLRDLIAYVATL